MIAIIIICLIIASTFDIRTKEVPLWIAPCGMVIRFVYLLIEYKRNSTDSILFECLLVALFLFLFMLIAAIFGRMGGADCLVGALIGLSLGIWGAYAVLIGFVLALPYTAYMRLKNNEHEYAFIPYLTLGLVIVVVIQALTKHSIIFLI